MCSDYPNFSKPLTGLYCEHSITSVIKLGYITIKIISKQVISSDTTTSNYKTRQGEIIFNT